MKHVFLNGHKWFDKHFQTVDHIIAVDGAYDYLIEQGISDAQIERVIGDFDSTQLVGTKAKFLCLEDQNHTDFEKTVMFLIDSGEDHIKVYFADGEEPDHFLGNLHVAAKYHADISIDFISELQHYCYVKDSEISLSATQLNKIISVIPFPQATVSMTGVTYPLNNQLLRFADNLSIRNSNSEKQIKIKVKGESIIFYDKSIVKIN